MKAIHLVSALIMGSLTGCKSSTDLQKGLIGHWPLLHNAQDHSTHDRHAHVMGSLSFRSEGMDSAAVFNGRDAWLQIPSAQSPDFGSADFSISVWIQTSDSVDDVSGDILSQYDAAKRNGFQLSLKSNAVTTSHSNFQHLSFGIDDQQQTSWQDVGKPGNALLAFSMAEYNGSLYVGTCEPGKDESGHVYRYAGGTQWEDYGSPDSSNSVMALAAYKGQLYAGTGKYRVSGSSLPESENTHLGGHIWRFEGPDKWADCGRLPATEAIGGMVVYRGMLYATSLYHPAFFRYEEGTDWVDCGTPEGKRVVALAVYNGYLYATSYDSGNVYRFDGKSWTDCGPVGDNTQTYSFVVYEGQLYVSTWPSGRVYQFEDIGKWQDRGRLGDELEVMGMLVQNGRLLGGTLPLAEVYTYEGDTVWQKMEQLDTTPDVKYRRAWTMAEHDGRVYCSTLPSGKIFAYEAGKSTFYGKSLDAGWHHIAALRSANQLLLYVDGKKVSQKEIPENMPFHLTGDKPLRIGAGANDYFLGSMKELRLYQRALTEEEISKLAQK